MDVFTKAEGRTLEDVSMMMAGLTARQSSDSTHSIDGPWHRAFYGPGKGSVIDMREAFTIEGLDGDERELAEAKESFELFRELDPA